MDSQAWGGKRGVENRGNLYKHRTPGPTRTGPSAQFETWNPPERITWTARHELDSLYSLAFMEHTNVIGAPCSCISYRSYGSNWLELHVADLCSAVSETSMISWLPVHLSIRTMCSVWHTHTGKKCHHSHCHVFRNSTRKWKRPYRSRNCTFGKIC